MEWIRKGNRIVHGKCPTLIIVGVYPSTRQTGNDEEGSTVFVPPVISLTNWDSDFDTDRKSPARFYHQNHNNTHKTFLAVIKAEIESYINKRWKDGEPEKRAMAMRSNPPFIKQQQQQH